MTPLCHSEFTIDPSWLNNEAFCLPGDLTETPLCMPCHISPASKQCKAMVSSATPVSTSRIIMLYYDTCASHTSSPFREDFEELDETATAGQLDGIASGLQIRGTGTVKYCIMGDDGKSFVIKLPAYWVPDLKCRLLTPQDLSTEDGHPVCFQTHPGYMGKERHAELLVKPKREGYSKLPPLQTVTMNFNRRNNLPTHRAELLTAQAWTAATLSGATCETSKHNMNLNDAQKELLQWHYRLRHIGFQHVSC